MGSTRIAVIGGGAAGFFGAVTCARLLGDRGDVQLLEKTSGFLSKVRISGGGRCNVTHACFDPEILSRHYPRGGRELRRAFHRFQPRDTIEWFESRGIPLKTEPDGRMFPVSDSSASIMNCLTEEALRYDVRLRSRCEVRDIQPTSDGFHCLMPGGEIETYDRVLLATGGPKSGSWWPSLQHKPEPPVPSLFTFHLAADSWLRSLPGVAVEDVEVSVMDSKLSARGPLLVTHSGVSGPAILKLSAWGAREWHDCDYRFILRVNWLPALSEEQVRSWIRGQREQAPARKPVNTPPPGIPTRLWETLLLQPGGPDEETRWTTLTRAQANQLVLVLRRSEFRVEGKSMNKEEFVTCGGIRRSEVDFSTMQSRVHPGLFLAGEVLDVDGVTGGFNFQAAWTTGWIAGHALAGRQA